MGAGDIYVCATHGIFSGPGVQRIEEAPIVECVVTDAVPLDPTCHDDKIKVISVADEFAECIQRIYNEISVSGMFGADMNL